MISILVPIVVGVGGVLATTFILKPYLKYREVLHDISYTLIFHGGLIMSMKYSQAPEEHKKVIKKIRSLAVKLHLSSNAALQKLGLIPSDKDLKEASGRMFRISARMYEDKKPIEELRDDTKEIERLLQV